MAIPNTDEGVSLGEVASVTIKGKPAGIPLNGKRVDFDQLQTELAAAGIAVSGIGSDGEHVFTYDGTGRPMDLPDAAAAVLSAHTASTAPRDQLTALLNSTVGVSLQSLTNAQRLALVAGLLYKAGAIDRATLTIRPLNTWLL
jgi:hypothetical protein